MGGTPHFELDFYGTEREAPPSVCRLIEDMKAGKVPEAGAGGEMVCAGLRYEVGPSEPEGLFAEAVERFDSLDTDPVVEKCAKDGDGVIRFRFVVTFSVFGGSDYMDEFLEAIYENPEYREAAAYLMKLRWRGEWSFRDSWWSDSTQRLPYCEYAGMKMGVAMGDHKRTHKRRLPVLRSI